MDESRLVSSARLVGILIVTEIVGMAAVGYSLHKKFGSNPITYLAFTLKKHTLVMLYATALNVRNHKAKHSNATQRSSWSLTHKLMPWPGHTPNASFNRLPSPLRSLCNT